MNEIIEIANSMDLIKNANLNLLNEKAKQMQEFKDFLKKELQDGIDFGLIPNIDKPSLFKAGGEKIQMFLGLTPQYKLLNRQFLANQKQEYKEFNSVTRKYETASAIRNYYAWEWSCELYYGDKKVAEGVGTANSEERKYVSQYATKETPDSLANTIMKISKKRAFMDAIIGVSGVSDIFTQDLEDDVTINKLKVDKETKSNKLSKDNIKTIMATVLALGLEKSDLSKVLNELGYLDIKECKAKDANVIIEKITQLAKSRKENENV